MAAWLVFFAIKDPSTMPAWFHCPFHAATGLCCPGCGSTRATHELLHTDLTGSLRHNPLLFAMGVPTATLFAAICVRTLRGDRRAVLPESAWLAWGLAGVIAAFWVVRNLPLDELSFLRAPGP